MPKGLSTKLPFLAKGPRNISGGYGIQAGFNGEGDMSSIVWI